MARVQHWIVALGVERSYKVRKSCILAIAGHLHLASCVLEVDRCFQRTIVERAQ